MRIRAVTNLDRDDIHDVYWTAFAEDERELVAKLAVDLVSEVTTPPTISLVAEFEKIVVGHVAFSPVAIENDKNFRGYILAPLAVKPGYQKRQIGSKLVESGMQQLSRVGVDVLFVYGDPRYYSRFSFSVDVAEHYIPPYELEYPFGWQGVAFNDCRAKKLPANIVCVTSLSDPALW